MVLRGTGSALAQVNTGSPTGGAVSTVIIVVAVVIFIGVAVAFVRRRSK